MKKIKQKLKAFMTGKSGFSLVELIVVIAIMAVLAAVLAPALLGYVERSRAQKDLSAMDEVTNAIQLAVADSAVYDELLQVSHKENYSCYADGDASTNTDANKIVTKSPDLWLYNDNARKLDETVYSPSGKMRGVSITLRPSESQYVLKDGIVNQIGDESTKKGDKAGLKLEDAAFANFYNRLRSTIGDTLKVSSQTYRNSDYTIFISMGTTGGSQADKQDAIQVYGQYNGTNLPTVSIPGGGTQTPGAGGDEGENPGDFGNEEQGLQYNALYTSTAVIPGYTVGLVIHDDGSYELFTDAILSNATHGILYCVDAGDAGSFDNTTMTLSTKTCGPGTVSISDSGDIHWIFSAPGYEGDFQLVDDGSNAHGMYYGSEYAKDTSTSYYGYPATQRDSAFMRDDYYYYTATKTFITASGAEISSSSTTPKYAGDMLNDYVMLVSNTVCVSVSYDGQYAWALGKEYKILEVPTEKALDGYTWEQIAEIARSGNADVKWNVGDSKTVTINGKVHEVVIIGFNHDANNSITFLVKGSIIKKALHDNADESAAWAGCSLRQWLSTTGMSWMPNDMKPYMLTVGKKTNNTGPADRTQVSETQDQLFLLSVNEVGLKPQATNSILSQEGTLYEYFATDGGNRRAGIENDWWLRSGGAPYASPEYYYSNTNGEFASDVWMGMDNCVCPAFVIG